MSKELNCTNCSIGDFKHELCDCDNGFCKEFKSIGTQEDFFNAVMQRIRPQGEWIVSEDGDTICSVCGASEEEFIFGTENWYGIGISNYCPNCGRR